MLKCKLHIYIGMYISVVIIKASVVKCYGTILFAPFTPLIAILCHVIETSNADDLELLKRFVVSLEPVCKFSEAIEQFHRLSQALYDVAASYLQVTRVTD